MYFSHTEGEDRCEWNPCVSLGSRDVCWGVLPNTDAHVLYDAMSGLRFKMLKIEMVVVALAKT